MTEQTGTINVHAALIYAMTISAAADSNMTDAELQKMSDTMHLPVFQDFNADNLPHVAAECADLLVDEEGLDTVIGLIANALSPGLRETAYALCLEVVAADLKAEQEELRLLELVRYGLDIDRLTAAAIERGVSARHRVA